jgi:hypothetical protein
MQAEIKTRSTIAKKILQEINFAAISERYDDVPVAHQRTCEWVLKSDGSHSRGQHHWSSFTKWLKEQDGIYWINGKAASGKSTLMKHIVTNFRTMPLLKEWASKTGIGTEIFHSATFFFWASGSALQRSQSGLLRSILYQLMRIDPMNLVPIVFPQEWSVLYARSLGYGSLPQSTTDVVIEEPRLVHVVLSQGPGQADPDETSFIEEVGTIV